MNRIIVTGGAGFIGSAVCRMLAKQGVEILNIDKLTYAGNLSSLEPVAQLPNYHFLHADICDAPAMAKAFAEFRPQGVMHLAAESHVDRSIDGPGLFLQTNVVGTYTMLEAAHAYWKTLPEDEKAAFRFLHISTDEVYGSLGPTGLFTEETPYAPRSPYSASKASADHLVNAWFHTYGLPTLKTNCSNNYGPYHFPEKLIPLVTLNALAGRPLPIYGKGDNIRDWLYVEDHARALWLASPTPSSSPSSRTAPATTPATPSTPPRSCANSVGSPKRPSTPASAAPSSGTSTTRPGGRPSARPPKSASAPPGKGRLCRPWRTERAAAKPQTFHGHREQSVQARSAKPSTATERATSARRARPLRNQASKPLNFQTSVWHFTVRRVAPLYRAHPLRFDCLLRSPFVAACRTMNEAECKAALTIGHPRMSTPECLKFPASPEGVSEGSQSRLRETR